MTRAHDYRGAFGSDGTRRVVKREVPEVPAEPGLVVEDHAGFCGAVVSVTVREVVRSRHAGFLPRRGRGTPVRHAAGS
jgi:hypothetical protein